MPVNNGWEVIEAARRHRGASFPVIMQTGEARYPYVQRRAAELAVAALIDKLDIEVRLVPAIREALGLGAAP